MITKQERRKCLISKLHADSSLKRLKRLRIVPKENLMDSYDIK